MGLSVFYKKALVTCSMLCCISLFTQAQDTLSLRKAVDIALKNSLDIVLARNDIEAATIFNNYGYAGGLPLVTGTVTDNEQVTSVNQKLNTGTSIKRNNASGNQLTAGVTGSILLYNGGRVIATKKRLEELEKQSNHRLTGQIQNTIADVMTAYYDIVRQQNYIKTIDKSIDASNQQLTIVKTRQNVGLANNADLFQAQIDLNALQQSRQAQELIVAQAKSELLRLLTLKADSAILIQDTIVVDNNVMLQNVLDNIPKSADIVAADDQIRINELIVKETQALRYPSVRALAGYSFSRNQAGAGQTLFNQSFGPSVGISLGIPIFNGSIYRRQAQVAKIDVRNADVQKQVLFRDYNANAVKQYQSYVSNLQQLTTERENYKLSQQLLDLVLQRFQLRQATIVEVKNAQQSFEESGYRLVNLSYAAKASEIELKRLGNSL
jgi:outer membrane protein TolC